MGSTIEIAKRNDAVVFTCNELAGYLSSKGIKTEECILAAEQPFHLENVKLTPAWHGCPIVEGSEVRYGGVACGFVIEVDGKKIYHSETPDSLWRCRCSRMKTSTWHFFQ